MEIGQGPNWGYSAEGKKNTQYWGNTHHLLLLQLRGLRPLDPYQFINNI
jgi:hypothetical protein